jgi:hypothetical protein
VFQYFPVIPWIAQHHAIMPGETVSSDRQSEPHLLEGGTMSAVSIAEAWPARGRPFTVDDLDRLPDDGPV